MSRLATLRRFRKETLDVLADDCARLVSELIDEFADVRLRHTPRLAFTNETVLSTDSRLILKPWQIARVDSTSATVDVYFPQLTKKDAGSVSGVIKLVSANSVRFNSLDGSMVNSLSSTSASVTAVGLSKFEWDGRIWWLHA